MLLGADGHTHIFALMSSPSLPTNTTAELMSFLKLQFMGGPVMVFSQVLLCPVLVDTVGRVLGDERDNRKG